MKYTAVLRYEDGRSFVEASDKLNVAEHFYDCFVANGAKSGQGFYVALKNGDQNICEFNGGHSL